MIKNFQLDCSGEGAIPWTDTVRNLAGYNNMPTAGNVAPQLMVNQDNTRTAQNVYESSTTPDASADLPPSLPPCSGSPWLGPRSRGFLDAVDVLLDADTPTRIARTGRADPNEKVGTVAASLAALHGMKEAIFENQAYSVVYATLDAPIAFSTTTAARVLCFLHSKSREAARGILISLEHLTAKRLLDRADVSMTLILKQIPRISRRAESL